MEVTINNNQSINDCIDFIKLRTLSMRNRDYNRASYFIITPDDSQWSFTLLSIVLNEFTGWRIDSKNGCRNQTKATGIHYSFFRFNCESDPEKHIICNITESIIVKASKSLVESWNTEFINASWYKLTFVLNIKSTGTRALIRGSPLLYYSEEDFSSIFRSFASFFVDNDISSYCDDTAHIFNYYTSFLSKITYEKIDLKTLKSDCEGYLYLKLIQHNDTGRKLDKIDLEEGPYFVLGGTYLSPFASDLIKNEYVRGMQLDTTFSILHNYVTSIPTLIAFNVGIPIGFSFSLTEDEDIYIDFFSIFQNVYGFPITQYIDVIQSDQGQALKSAVKKLGIKHIFCLRHFLVSLKKSQFSYQVGNLVQATCDRDYKALKQLYENSWKDLSKQKLKKLKNILKKAGLDFIDNEIIIDNSLLWKSVSMQERHWFRMPSCTNQIESCHGHMNAYTPRRNELLTSIRRIIHEIIDRDHNFKSNFHQNILSYQRKIKRIVKYTPADIMNEMINNYETNMNENSCNCGDSLLISSMIGVQLPCSHLHYLGIDFPKVTPPKISMINQTNGELIIEYDFKTSENVQTNSSYYTKMHKYVISTIKMYSHSKKANAIKKFVLDKLPFDKVPEKFVLGYPIEVFSAIDQGVLRFYKAKKITKKKTKE